MRSLKPLPGASTAPLLFWLLLLCGLGGVTIVSADTARDLPALWIASVVGLGLGQLLAGVRVRAWLAASVVFLAWLQAVILLEGASSALSLATTAYFPAALAGYLSLSERGVFAAFWYPAMLWMVVLLDRPRGALDAAAALPFVVGLAAFFVAFLVACESRRLAIWRARATTRLAHPGSRVVLRSSPVRAAWHHAWTVLVGVGALVMTAWIAPHLWQKENAMDSTLAHDAAGTTTATTGGDAPCCAPAELRDERRQRIVEYLPFLHGHPDVAAGATATSCVRCNDGPGVADAGAGTGETSVCAADPSPATPAVGTSPSIPPATPPPHATIAPVAAATHPVVEPLARTALPTASKRAVAAIVQKSAAPPLDAGTPWARALLLAALALMAHVLLRALRRQFTLRHLTSPLWKETVDQRFSNHWERMLVGLRDAGIHPMPGERPLAFARRIGIEGMETCATILERARHGVRIDEADLDAMSAAASGVFERARRMAGAPARVVASIRWPLT